MGGKNIAFVLDHKLSHYRKSFFEQLSDLGYYIDIYHQGPYLEGFKRTTIKQIVVKTKTPLSKLLYFELPSLDSYSIVIIMQNLRLLNLSRETFLLKRQNKIIHWGIGVSSANGLKLKKSLTSRLRNILAKYSDALILYSDYPLPLFSEQVKVKTFIANNTIFNPDPKDLSAFTKESFLFIGSLNKRKG